MIENKTSQPFYLHLFLILVLLSFVAACGNADPAPPLAQTPNSTIAPTPANGTSTVEDNGYPSVDDAYGGVRPTQEGVLAEIPNPEIDFPEPETATGVIGGILAAKINGQGYIPVTPKELILGEVIQNSNGEDALIKVGDGSRRAELFNTGIFIFNQVQPGTYGLIIDLGIGQVPVLNMNGEQMLVTVEPGKATDLGQILIALPNSG